MVKNPPADAGDVRSVSSIPGSGRSPGGRHSHPLQYSCLENPMDRGDWWAMVHGVSKSWTRLKGLSTHERMRMKVSRGSSPRHKDAWPTRVLGPVEFTGDYKAAGGQGPMPFLHL